MVHTEFLFGRGLLFEITDILHVKRLGLCHKQSSCSNTLSGEESHHQRHTVKNVSVTIHIAVISYIIRNDLTCSCSQDIMDMDKALS